MGRFVITSYKEELHYQLFTGQFVITSYREEGLHYHLFTGQFVVMISETAQ
jgi:hypothetical protein